MAMKTITLKTLSSPQNISTEFFLKTCSLLDVALDKQSTGYMKPFFALPGNTKVYDAIKQMKEQDIQSIVIYDVDEDGRKNYNSIVTCLDFLNWFCWKKESAVTAKISISELSGITEETKSLWLCPVTMHLESVVQPFMQGIHALVVLKKKKPRRMFISQTDVVRFLYNNRFFIREARELFERSIKDSGILGRLSKPARIESGKPVELGFELMTNLEVRGIAVVDGEGRLVSNLSSKHANELLSEDMEKKMRMQTVEQFLQSVNEPFGVGKAKNIATENTSLVNAMELLVTQHFHIVWVLDEAGVLKKVMTLSDVIKELVLFDFYKDYDANSEAE